MTARHAVPAAFSPSDQAFQVGTARALAKFMARLDALQLTSVDDSVLMLYLMNKDSPPGNATKSFFRDGLAASLPQNLQDSSFVVISKLGINGLLSDAAIIQHKITGGGLIRYAAVGLGEPNSDKPTLLTSLILQLDSLITSLHAPKGN